MSYLVSQYPNLTAAALALKVHREQLTRLVDAGALYDANSGEVWIRSKTKIKTPAVAYREFDKHCGEIISSALAAPREQSK
jgi:hypothetical protein